MSTTLLSFDHLPDWASALVGSERSWGVYRLAAARGRQHEVRRPRAATGWRTQPGPIPGSIQSMQPLTSLILYGGRLVRNHCNGVAKRYTIQTANGALEARRPRRMGARPVSEDQRCG